MTSKDRHQKHAFLVKPSKGQFARQEIGFLGAPCGLIKKIAQQLYDQLKDQYQLMYVDADHGDATDSVQLPTMMDMISHHRIDFESQLNDFDARIALQHVDLALVNGNHFSAAVQIPIIHKSKEESLRRKLDRLTNVAAIILDDCGEPFDFVTNHLAGKKVPIIKMEDLEQLTSLITSLHPVSSVNGLVLAGGKSSRMGQDKSVINYHGTEQQIHMASMMKGLCGDVYISKRQTPDVDLAFPIITDSFLNLGPYGAILSAFRHDPNVAWLVTACDQPLLQSSHLRTLIDERDPTKIATCFYNPDTDFPEPLITIWEPKAYPKLLEYLALGYSCPRKLLINADIKLIKVMDTHFMKNVNTPEERKEVSLGL